MSYTTYLFDFDYTLVDSSRGITTCFRHVLTRHGYTEVTDEDIKRTIGKTLEESFSILTGVADEQQLADLKKEYVREADEHMTVNTEFFPETKAVLTALKERGARLGIISTKYRYRIQELLQLHFPGDFMDVIIGGEDVKTPKPSPEGILLAMEQLQAGKGDVLYVGDSTIDAETAQAAGVDFIGVTHGVTTAGELGSYPHRKIISTLEELPEGKEEIQPAAGDPVPVPPQDPSPTLRRKKLINIWQLLLLLVILFFVYQEQTTSGSYFFLLVFVLTLWGIVQRRRLLPDKAKAFMAPWWHPCEVRLRAVHIRLINGKKVPSVSQETHACQNCGTTYTGNFCHRCGQSSNTPRYHLSNALKNIVGGFTNIDNGFGRTLTELLYRPGFMIRDFIGGKRVHYFRPFQTLFILAALYIMCVQLVDPEALEKKEASPKDKKESIIASRQAVQTQLDKTKTPAEQKALALALQNLDKQLKELEKDSSATGKENSLATRKEVQPRPDTAKIPAGQIPVRTGKNPEKQLKNPEKDSPAVRNTADNDSHEDDFVDELLQDGSEVGDKLEAYLQHSPFLLKVWNLMKSWGHGNKAFRIIATLPLFALATQLAFYRRKKKMKYNLTEHVFIQAYIACQVLLLSILILPFFGKANISDLYEVPLLFIFFLFCWDYKQLYRCTWWSSFWRTLLMFLYSLILMLFFAIIIVVLAVAIIQILKP